ncbi:AAA family ATPase [Fusobacterium polymorphum]|uniref:AAA family ATPase n=1 Tax=Fusobacterium nucleatum subsp. polymorphum TaxID=76857 RepID=UPI002365A6EB|nr:AAA family ATPase [Fusobacterium nucleatum]WDF23831.1 AAA family ATPase [Fusobacterium nucleatum]
MFPIFMWVKKYKSLENFQVNFDKSYNIEFEYKENRIKKLIIKKNINKIPKHFYGRNINSINIIIGKNGTGKSSILEMMSLFDRVNGTYKSYVDYPREFLIIYKTNNEKEFILEGYHENDDDKYFEFLKMSKDSLTFLVNYYTFKMTENYEFIGTNSPKNLKDTGILRIKYGEERINFFEKKYSYEEAEQGNYKINTGVSEGNKATIYEYFINKKNIQSELYRDANIVIEIPELDFYIDKIKNPFEIIKEIKLFNILKEEKIKDVVIKNYSNYLFSYKIWEIIENKSFQVDKILDIIKTEKIKLKKIKNTEQILERLLDEIKEYENVKELSNKIHEILLLLNDVQVSELNFKRKTNILKKYKIKGNDSRTKKFLEKYDEIVNYPWTNKRLYLPEFEKILNITEEGMSDGERVRVNIFSTIHRFLGENGELKNKKYVTLLFDEVEMFLHPEWSRTFLHDLLLELKDYRDKQFKIIFASHSPFLLSDICSEGVIYLEKKERKTILKEIEIKNFGANIIDLFKNTMFLKSTFGEFATEKIKKVVKKIDETNSYSFIKNNHEINYIIEEIGEKLISNKLKSMIEAKLENEVNDKEYYKNKIEEYQAKIREIEEKEGEK